MRVAEGNRLRPGLPAAGREGGEAHVAWLDGQIEAIGEGVAAAVRRAPAWRDRDRLLRSVEGVGPVVSRTLPADLPELGTRPPGTLAALAGPAPFAADGGRKRGERPVRGGRREVRRALDTAALAVAVVPGPPGDVPRRLKGKASKVVLIAVARTLLVVADAVTRDGRAWDPKMAPAARLRTHHLVRRAVRTDTVPCTMMRDSRHPHLQSTVARVRSAGEGQQGEG